MRGDRKKKVHTEARRAVATLPNAVWAAISFEDIRARVRRVVDDASDQEIRRALDDLVNEGVVYRRPQTPTERERDRDGWYGGINLAEHEVEATKLADWLEQEAPERLWSVDGERRIIGEVNLPCSGRDLAQVIRRLGGTLSVLGPADAKPNEDLGQLADSDDGLVFQLAWRRDSTLGERWQLAEDNIHAEGDLRASG